MAIRNIQQTNARIILAKFITTTLLVAALPLAQPLSGQTASSAGEPACSVETLKGKYSWVGNGYVKLPDQNDPNKTVTVPSASIAFITFYGNGRFDLLIDVVFDGIMLRENHRVTDTYVVKPDCTGVLGSGIQGPSFDIMVARDGTRFLLIDKNPGGTGASEVKRIAKF